MDSSVFAEELEKWMRDSGKVKEMRTKLRADLVEAIRGRRGPDNNRSNSSTSAPLTSRALNSLFLEHLLRCGMWYTASVFSSEGEFLLDSGIKSASAPGDSKLSDEDISRLLSALDLDGLARESEALRVDYYRRRGASLVECLLRAVDRSRSSSSSVGSLLNRLEEIERLIKEREVGDGRMEREVDGLRRKLSRSEEESFSQSTQTVSSREEEKSNQIKELRDELEAAREEIRRLKEDRRKEELQRKEDDRRTEEDVLRGPVDAFVSDVRSRVDLLYKSSVSIDKEFSQL